MSNHQHINFIVEDGLNTSYINSLLMALFYKSSKFNNILYEIPKDPKFAYLQNLIQFNFVSKVTQHYSVSSDVINEIRNYMFVCKWRSNSVITKLYNVVDCFDFLIKNMAEQYEIYFELVPLNIMPMTVNEIKMYHINIDLNDNYNTNIKNLLDDWIKKNLLKNDSESKPTSQYQFHDPPTMIPIYLNRKMENNQINNCRVDIMERIKFNNNNNKTQNEISWMIHSIICYSNSLRKHYYSIIKNDYMTIKKGSEEWFMFNEFHYPSMCKVDIKQEDISDKIKRECVMIFYHIDEITNYFQLF